MSEQIQRFVEMREASQAARQTWLTAEQDYSVTRVGCDALKSVATIAQRDFEAYAYQPEIKREVVAAIKSGTLSTAA